jgi:hypothetical protein
MRGRGAALRLVVEEAVSNRHAAIERLRAKRCFTGVILSSGGWEIFYAGGAAMKYGLFWLLGVPIPVLIVAYLIFH